jgi:hypothetical protein
MPSVEEKSSTAHCGTRLRRSTAEIFHRSLWDKVTTIDGLSNPDYDPSPLELILGEELGDTWLSESHGAELMVPSYAIQLPFEQPGDGLGLLIPRAPYFFKTWKAKGTKLDQGDNRDELDFRLKDIARATSAAPTYFPPALIQNRAGQSFGMIDGGVFANNPAMCALVSAYKLFPQIKKFMLVSLGTGSLERPIPYAEAKNWGLVHWARPILNVLFDGNSDTTSYEVDQILGASHYRFDISLGMNPKQDPTRSTRISTTPLPTILLGLSGRQMHWSMVWPTSSEPSSMNSRSRSGFPERYEAAAAGFCRDSVS